MLTITALAFTLVNAEINEPKLTCMAVAKATAVMENAPNIKFYTIGNNRSVFMFYKGLQYKTTITVKC